MKITKIFAASLLLSSTIFLSCEKADLVEVKEDVVIFEFKGGLEAQGITTYQYGTHVISNNTIFYALRSQTITLDNYIGETVTIKGTKVDGYPVDGGPDYIEVTEVIQ